MTTYSNEFMKQLRHEIREASKQVIAGKPAMDAETLTWETLDHMQEHHGLYLDFAFVEAVVTGRCK